MKLNSINVANSEFRTAITSVTGRHKVGWKRADHDGVVKAMIAGLKMEDETPASLPRPLSDLVMAIVSPTPERQQLALKKVLEDAGFEMDSPTQEMFQLLCDMAGFSNSLAKDINPETKKPFIIKEPKRKKRDTFTNLLKEMAEEDPAQLDVPVEFVEHERNPMALPEERIEDKRPEE